VSPRAGVRIDSAPVSAPIVEELRELIAIPSVSADVAQAAEVRRAAEWVRDFIRRAGGQADLVETHAQPLVIGELRASESPETAPTILVYGHFDVQPPSPLELWESDPFDLVERDGWYFARGITDDKGQLYALLRAAADLAAEGALPVNVRIASDGEEEVGGDSIVAWVQSDDRRADACVIFDGGMERRDVPQFCTGTRGLVAFDLVVRTGARDMHSGMYGNAALNATHALIQTLASVLPRDGRAPEPLRAGVEPPTDDERAGWRQLPSGGELLELQGAIPYDDRAADEFWLRTTAETSVDVNGIIGGKPGLRNTTIPVAAAANFTVRLAPGQDVATVAAAVDRLVREAVPLGAEIELRSDEGTPASIVDPDTPAVTLGKEAFERVFGRPPLLARGGGTLPIMAALTGRGIPTILTGVGLPESNVHSPNEKLPVDYLTKAYQAGRELFTAFADLPRS
jgi:acetylornithine deacetylase/succinyl-diaminopimelate desuccinylase-like protein